jgi:hypothetical protein
MAHVNQTVLPGDHKRAHAIMGENMLGITEVERCFGRLTTEQALELVKIPFGDEILRGCAQTHILVADIGISLLEVLVRACGAQGHENDWLNDKEFAQSTGVVARWRLVRKEPIEKKAYCSFVGFFTDEWSQQKVSKDGVVDEVPTARELVYTMILYFLVVGKRLFQGGYVNTSDSIPGSEVDHVKIGRFKGNSFGVYYWAGFRPHGSRTIARSRTADIVVYRS